MSLTFQDSRLLDPRYQQLGLRRIRQLHGTGLQQDVSFGDVWNAQQGRYDFSKLDAEINAARAMGLTHNTLRLFGTPTYQAKNGAAANLSANNPNADAAGKFAEAVAQHFAGRVDRYGVWNEPNVPSFLNRPARAAAKDYELIYRKMRSAIKGVRPASQVGFGEITAQQPNTPGYSSTIGFLKAVLQQSRKPIRADYVGIHPYQWSNPNSKPGNAWYGGVSNIGAVQAELAKQAKAGKLVTSRGRRVPLAVTEFGYKHDAVKNSATRAAYMRRAMEIFRENGVRDVNLYQLFPSKAGDYWDSSILGPQGQMPKGYGNLAKGLR